MSYAVPIDPLNAIVFSAVAPPRGLGAFHGPVQANVTLEPPEGEVFPGLFQWPEGEPRPEVILCVARDDPKRYALFKYRNQVDPSVFRETGRTFVWLGSRSQFENLIRAVVRLKHAGEWVAWTQGGRRFLAAGPTSEAVHEAVERTGVEAAVYEWVEPAGVGA